MQFISCDDLLNVSASIGITTRQAAERSGGQEHPFQPKNNYATAAATSVEASYQFQEARRASNKNKNKLNGG